MRTLFALVLFAGTCRAQVCAATGNEFTMVFFFDVHSNFNPGFSLDMSNWTVASAAACNMKFIGGLGDYVTDLSGIDTATEWGQFTTNFYNPIHALGIPGTWAQGNHDLYSTFYNDTFTPTNTWTSCYPSCANPINQYQALDVVIGGKTYRFGIIAGQLDVNLCVSAGVPGAGCTGPGTTSGAVGAWAKGILDSADPTRQFFYTNHMNVSNATQNWCTIAAGDCSGRYAGQLTWDDFLKNFGQIRWAFNGHDGFTGHWLTTTNTAGYTVQAIGDSGASGNGNVGAIVVKFRPDTSDMLMWAVDRLGGTGYRSIPNATWAWTPNGTDVTAATKFVISQ